MRVLYATYPWAFHTPGGGEIQLVKYAHSLQALGVNVRFFDPWQPDFQSYDLVHFFSCMGGSEHFCRFIRTLGIPLAISSSLWITRATAQNYDIGMIQSQLACADAIVTNSMMESNELSRVLNIQRSKFHHVYNGVDRKFFSAKKSNKFTERFKIESRYVLCVGNIEPRKNQKSLIEAIESFDNLQLVLIGHVRDQQYFDDCKISEHDKVRYIGPLPEGSDILISAIQNAAAFALPSTLETPGIAALEAAACGTPLVITTEGSTYEYFATMDVQFVNPNSLDSIVSGISAALKQKFVERGDRLYSWDEVAHQLLTLYKAITVNG